MTHRDPKSGRYARRPVPDVDAESRFDLMGDDIPFEDVAGQSSANTLNQPRYAPAGDELAQGGEGSRLRARRPELVSEQDADHTLYGRQGAVLRAAARGSVDRTDDPTSYLVGLPESHGTPANGLRQVGDVPDVPDPVRGDLRPTGRGQGRDRWR